MSEQQALEVTNNEAEHRFELNGQGSAARLDYTIRDGAMWLVHTEVPESMAGHGAGAALARAGLQYARNHGLQVVPRCPFVAAYIRRHPEYADLVRSEAS